MKDKAGRRSVVVRVDEAVREWIARRSRDGETPNATLRRELGLPPRAKGGKR